MKYIPANHLYVIIFIVTLSKIRNLTHEEFCCDIDIRPCGEQADNK